MSAKRIVYQFKIALSGVNPPVWRLVQIPADYTLSRTAAVLIVAMGWHGGHLHQFRIGEDIYGWPDQEFADDLKIHDEREVRLIDIIETGVTRFIFEYDFGDDWEHTVEFEKKLDAQPGARYPQCIGGARRCPPEDCGGSHGYQEFLEAVGDPKHPEHDSMREWIGGAFDLEEFSIDDYADLAKRAREMEKAWEEYS